MFQLIEKDNERKAVYSLSDLQYMMNRGWLKVAPAGEQDAGNSAQAVTPAAESPAAQDQKRKYTRRAK